MLTRTYGVLVVRIWFELGEHPPEVWRACVTDTATNEKHYFATPEALSLFLLTMNLPYCRNDTEEAS